MNHLDIAPQYSSFVRSISNTIGTIPGIVAPLVAGLVVAIPASTKISKITIEIPVELTEISPSYEDKVLQHVNQWKNVFIITAHVYFLGCIFYWFYSSGEIQPWAKSPEYTSGITSTNDIESNSAEATEIEKPTRRRNKNSNAKNKTNCDSSIHPSVHKSSSKHKHKSPARSKDNRKDKNKNFEDSEALKIGARLLKMYDRFAN